MSSRQLYDLTPQELADHAQEIYDHAQEIHEAAREALAAARRERRGVGMEAAAATAAAAARAAARAAVRAVVRAEDLAEAAAEERAGAIANLDILHRQQMMGEWSGDIDNAAIREQTSKASVIAKKQEVKKHMGSMLGDWDKAGKLSKRRIRKMKTKRRRQKITKRRRK
jgi:hypothetical protein